MTRFLPLARQALTALALITLPAGAGIAKTVQVVPGQVIGQAEIPDAWTVGKADRGLEIASPDQEVMMWMEVFRPDQIETVLKEHEAYFTQQGVRITGAPVENTSVANGVRLLVQDLPATWKGAKTVLAYQVYAAENAPTQIMLITYWASPEGDAKYMSQVRSVIAGTVFKLR